MKMDPIEYQRLYNEYKKLSTEELKDKMTPKQKVFCDEYLIDLNAAAAAKRTGYSKKTAQTIGKENIHKPLLAVYIERVMEEKDKNRIASQEEVLETLTRIMRREEKEHIVVTTIEEKQEFVCDETGKPRKRTVKQEVAQVIPIKSKLIDVNKAAELMGKRYKLWTDKTEIAGAVPVVIAGDEEIEE